MVGLDWLWLWLRDSLGFLVFVCAFGTVMYLAEKRTVCPYGELESAPAFGDPTGHGARWVADAVRAGFVLLGWARDTRGSLYPCSYALLVSADRTTFAVICVGVLWNVPILGTWLHTPAMDGRAFNTTDRQSGVQIDISHNWTNQLAPSPTFTCLLHKHQYWFQTQGVFPRPFAKGREFQEFKAMREQHFRSMERAGLIRFIGPSASHFYFTLSGAARTATWSYLVGLLRGLSQGSFPRSA